MAYPSPARGFRSSLKLLPDRVEDPSRLGAYTSIGLPRVSRVKPRPGTNAPHPGEASFPRTRERDWDAEWHPEARLGTRDRMWPMPFPHGERVRWCPLRHVGLRPIPSLDVEGNIGYPGSPVEREAPLNTKVSP